VGTPVAQDGWPHHTVNLIELAADYDLSHMILPEYRYHLSWWTCNAHDMLLVLSTVVATLILGIILQVTIRICKNTASLHRKKIEDKLRSLLLSVKKCRMLVKYASFLPKLISKEFTPYKCFTNFGAHVRKDEMPLCFYV